MKRTAVLVLMLAAGCTSAPIADVMDYWEPSPVTSTAARPVLVETDSAGMGRSHSETPSAATQTSSTQPASRTPPVSVGRPTPAGFPPAYAPTDSVEPPPATSSLPGPTVRQ